MHVPHLPPSISREEYKSKFVLPIQVRIINVLRRWMESSFYDFSDELIERVSRFINEEVANSTFPSFANHAKQLNAVLKAQIAKRQQDLSEQVKEEESITAAISAAQVEPAQEQESETAREQAKEPEEKQPPTPTDGNPSQPELESEPGTEPKEEEKEPDSKESVGSAFGHAGSFRTPKQDITEMPLSRVFPIAAEDTDKTIISATHMTLFDKSAKTIAEQLTFQVAHIYRNIRPFELLSQRFTKHRELAPNVVRLTALFNELSSWFATLIVAQNTPQSRAAMIHRILLIAQCLEHLNNFDSLMAVVSALGNSAVYRLARTHALVSVQMSQWADSIRVVMNNTGSFRLYRQMLHTVQPPCVPFLGVYLTDLTFVEDGNPDMVNGLINFRKRQLVFQIIQEIQLYQETQFPIRPIPSLLALLQSLPILDDDALYSLSLQREPRTPK